MKIVYRKHAELRIKLRNINRALIIKILYNKDEEYYDTATKYFVAIKRVEYREKIRPVAVVFEKIGKTTEVVTVFPTKEREIKSRIILGRWIYESTIH